MVGESSGVGEFNVIPGHPITQLTSGGTSVGEKDGEGEVKGCLPNRSLQNRA